ncbi:MAG: DUF190 domain-containing protein [Bacteroidales bacterium]|nr:DUF190 domain-containing protein [Bacteroidales bacterium]
MELNGEAKLLRIFVGSGDKIGNTPLYEAIVLAAKKYGVAGATVLRGVMGYGANSFVHTAKILALSEDLPMVIEMVDEASKIDGFIKQVEKFFDHPKYGGLITTEKVQVLVYKKQQG